MTFCPKYYDNALHTLAYLHTYMKVGVITNPLHFIERKMEDVKKFNDLFKTRCPVNSRAELHL